MKNIEKLKTQLPIHIVQASRLCKIYLTYLVFGKNDTEKYVNLDIKEKFWKENGGSFHPPICVTDVRKVKPINLIELGLKRGVFYK